MTPVVNEYSAIANALANEARKSIAAARAVDRARPIGEKRLDVNFYSKAERDKPATDYDFKMGGRHYKGRGALWSVWFVKWTGDRWQPYRRVSGPMSYGDALTRLVEECNRRGLPRVQ